MGSAKVRHLSTAHPITDTRIVYKECKSLQARGYDVALIACHDGNTEVAGVPIIGIGAAKSRTDRMIRKSWQMLAAALRESADIYHFHDPELIFTGVLLRCFGKKVIYDVHEDVPKQILHKFWIPSFIRKPIAKIFHALEQLAAWRMSAIVAATPAIAEKFSADKTIICQNFPEIELAVQRNEVPFNERPYAFVYVGGLTRPQGIFEIVSALGKLPEDVTGVLAGDFDEEHSDILAMPGWKHVDYRGRIQRDEVVEVLKNGRVGLVIDHPTTNYVDGYSTKMFEYMACGLPFIASNFPLWVDIVGNAECGVTVDPFDISAVVAALNKYLDNPDLAAKHGENGRQAILTQYNWKIESEKLLACYERTL